MNYLYETHLHTSQASICAVSPGRDYIRRYKDLGYAGIIITDHFYNGNTAIDRSLPWNRWVDRFCRGYEEARNEGAKQGLDVFFGWEETFDDDDYLVYGLDKEWLLEHPEAACWTRREQYETAVQYGGCVVQAHPFRQHAYIRGIHLSTGCVHGVEAANGGNHSQSYDALAMRYAKRLGLPVTAGSDIHSAADVQPGGVFGVYLDTKMTSIQDYVQAIRQDRIQGLRMTPGRCDCSGAETVDLPVDIRGPEDRRTDQDLWTFLG
ncbi:MAG: PHP domain-containing protein [Treponema sp.]|nr:PHP domain-containing protein [Treponema sp.]